MSLKTVKNVVPWGVAAVAVIALAVGYVDGGREQEGAVQAQSAEVAAALAELSVRGESEKAVALTAPEDPYQTVAVAPAPVSDLAPEAMAASYAPDAGTARDPGPATPEAKQAPASDTRQAALGSTAGAAEFFAKAQADLAAQTSCKEDLQALASQAQVYFPSGGLTADVNGMELARLIGGVAQACPGVRIEVQGHSDPSGDPATNLALSTARAEKVIQRLGAAGIDTSLFVAKGYGDTRPSSVDGPETRAYYDRRVEFAVIETAAAPQITAFGATPGFELPACVTELQAAVANTKLFYSARSISVLPKELEIATQLAQKAMACPQARLRVIGHHSDDVQDGESIRTGVLRAKALMGMLVNRGVAADQVIISAPSRSGGPVPQPGLSNSRIDFDVIVEGG